MRKSMMTLFSRLAARQLSQHNGPRKVLLYLRTLRHLRAKQLVYGVFSRIRFDGFALRGRKAPPITGQVEKLSHAIIELGVDPSRASVRRADQAVAGSYDFLNHREDLVVIDWKRRYVNRLWTYQLHYFDYALDLAWAFRLTGEPKYIVAFEALVSTWIDTTEDSKGDGWDAYPTSVRTVNWIYSLLLLRKSLSAEFCARLEASLFRQLCFLERRIEWQLLGNHVLRNLRALVVGGLFFDGAHAENWKKRFTPKLWDQTIEQVLGDGGHFERSPMYHGIVLSDLLEVIHLVRARDETVPREIVERARQMARALNVVARMDKSLRLLNDSANCIAPSFQHLESVADHVVGLPVWSADPEWSLPETGYYGYRDAPGRSELIVSCGTPSPAYQPGHAHCDILSYEWDAYGEQVIVDSGLHGYDGDAYREYVRSTRAHNTVVIAGKNQSEAWATFRFARRAKDARGSSALRDGRYTFEGSYRPYHDGRSLHRRTIVVDRDELAVTDAVEDQNEAPLESFVHFHPDFSVSVADGRATAVRGALRLSIEPFGIDALAVVRGQHEPKQGWYCEEFGKAVPQDVLVMRIAKNRGAEFGYRIRPVSAFS